MPRVESNKTILGTRVQKDVLSDLQVTVIQLEGVWEARPEKQIGATRKGQAMESGLNLIARLVSNFFGSYTLSKRT